MQSLPIFNSFTVISSSMRATTIWPLLATLGPVHADQVAVEDAVVAHRVALDLQQVIRGREEEAAVEQHHVAVNRRRRRSARRRRPGPAPAGAAPRRRTSLPPPRLARGPDSSSSRQRRMPRAWPGMRLIQPACSSTSRWYWAARTPLKPKALAISACDGGTPSASTRSVIRARMACWVSESSCMSLVILLTNSPRKPRAQSASASKP